MDAMTMTNRTLGFVNAPVIGQQLVEQLIDSSVDVAIYDRRRQAMAAALRRAGIEFAMPRGAFYFFPKAPGGDDRRFVDLLLEENVLAVPGRGFGFPGHFRLTFCVDEEGDRALGAGVRRGRPRRRAEARLAGVTPP